MTLATVPGYKLRESTQVLPFDDCLDGFLAEETSRRNAEFWWLPAHDRCVLKTFVETEEEPFRVKAPEALPSTIERYLKPDAVDWSWRIYPSTRTFPLTGNVGTRGGPVSPFGSGIFASAISLPRSRKL